MKLTKYNFLSKKPKIFPVEIIIFLVIVSLVIYAMNYKTYDKSSLKMQVFKEESSYYGKINLYETNIEDFNEKTIIKIDKEDRVFKLKQINELEGNPLTGQNYQEVIMEIELKEEEKKENIYLDLTVLNNYQSLFNKTLNLFI